MGQAFGPFELDRLIGRGGMAEVYLGHRRDDAGAMPLVLKRVRPELGTDEELLKRMRFEATVASRLSHPNLVRLLEFGKVGDCHYLAMEQVKGYSLKRIVDQAIDRDLPPPIGVALAIAGGILAGLSAMHRALDDAGKPRPILHRDVTPANVIVTHEGRPVLIDFGIAKDVLGPGITQVGKVIGTARYMAPEHRLGNHQDPRSDVFSASMVLFELITARYPWPPMSPQKELLRIVFDSPEITDELRARIPQDVLPILLSGLECNMDKRFADAGAMADALEATASLRSVRQAGDDLAAATRAWVRALDLEPDEALQTTVIDSRAAKLEAVNAPPMVWSSQGKLKLEAQPMSEPPPEGATAKRVTIPPLAPIPVRASLEVTADLELAARVDPRSRHRRWLIGILAGIGVLLTVLGLARALAGP
ncbi:MAG: serine/threonine protein kinase [Deltaproteobacteria bacterium]|nr:serine/threonine protein kinase [Deltaproteobacteria bacterium]